MLTTDQQEQIDWLLLIDSLHARTKKITTFEWKWINVLWNEMERKWLNFLFVEFQLSLYIMSIDGIIKVIMLLLSKQFQRFYNGPILSPASL